MGPPTNPVRFTLLDQFLTPYQPSVRDSRNLLGWELPTPLYLVVALCVPSAILMWLLIDLRFLRRTRVLLQASTPSKTTALIMQSILVDRLEEETVARQWSRAAVVTVALFALASAAAAFVITAPLHASTVDIEGALYLNPSQFPKVSLASAPFPKPPEFWTALWLTVVAANAVSSMLIWRELAKRR